MPLRCLVDRLDQLYKQTAGIVNRVTLQGRMILSREDLHGPPSGIIELAVAFCLPDRFNGCVLMGHRVNGLSRAMDYRMRS